MDFFAKIETDNDNLIVPCFTENIKSEYYNFKKLFLKSQFWRNKSELMLHH